MRAWLVVCRFGRWAERECQCRIRMRNESSVHFCMQLQVLVLVLAMSLVCAADIQCACHADRKDCRNGMELCGPGLATGLKPLCFVRAEVFQNRTATGLLVNGWAVTNYGCFFSGEAASRTQLLKYTTCGDVKEPNAVSRCCGTDMCNVLANVIQSLPTLPPISVTTAGPSAQGRDDSPIVLAVAILGSFVVLAAISFFAFTAYRRKHKGKPLLPRHNESSTCKPSSSKPPLTLTETQADPDCSLGDSSGRGNFQLEQRTVSREISLVNRIGNGRYGEVYRGVWRGYEVAVKIFRTMDEASFFREVELFNTSMLRHENIVGFLAADNLDCSLETQLWMVLEYHSNGSLFDYLRHHTASCAQPHSSLTLAAVLKLAASTAAGLAHLHLHVGGLNVLQSMGHKPSIAHRDLKTKNILVKSNGLCCIADLGMAVREGSAWNDVSLITPENLKAGTRRYMAPEVINGSINTGSFESFRQADMYALAIVLWEILTCCHLDGCKEPCYRLPYEDVVPGDPTAEDMYKAVCSAACRPPIAQSWREHEELKEICRILRTCWKASPGSRLPARNVSKKLSCLLGSVSSKTVDVPAKNEHIQ